MICAVGLAGNSAVLYVLLRTPRKKNVTNLFILSLAIAGELFTPVLPINIADFLLRQWPSGSSCASSSWLLTSTTPSPASISSQS